MTSVAPAVPQLVLPGQAAVDYGIADRVLTSQEM